MTQPEAAVAVPIFTIPLKKARKRKVVHFHLYRNTLFLW